MVLTAATLKIIYMEIDVIAHTVVKIYPNVHHIKTLIIIDVHCDSLNCLHTIDEAN